MQKNMKSALKVAVLAGFMAGAAAKATAADKMKKATDAEGDKAKAEKSGCGGPNGCSGECTGKTDAKMSREKMKKMANKQVAPSAAEKTVTTPSATPATEPVKK